VRACACVYVYVCVCVCDIHNNTQDQAVNTILGALAGVAVGGASQYLRDKALVDAAPYVTIAYDDDNEF